MTVGSQGCPEPQYDRNRFQSSVQWWGESQAEIWKRTKVEKGNCVPGGRRAVPVEEKSAMVPNAVPGVALFQKFSL